MFYNDATLSELNSANNSSSYVSKYIILWWKLQMAQSTYSSMIEALSFTSGLIFILFKYLYLWMSWSSFLKQQKDLPRGQVCCS